MNNTQQTQTTTGSGQNATMSTIEIGSRVRLNDGFAEDVANAAFIVEACTSYGRTDEHAKALVQQINQLKSQRDELLAACKLALLVMTDSILCGSDDINQVKRAIARAEGGQP